MIIINTKFIIPLKTGEGLSRLKTISHIWLLSTVQEKQNRDPAMEIEFLILVLHDEGKSVFGYFLLQLLNTMYNVHSAAELWPQGKIHF